MESARAREGGSLDTKRGRERAQVRRLSHSGTSQIGIGLPIPSHSGTGSACRPRTGVTRGRAV
eukprot:2224905-Prymnesium_polylepis.1